MRHSLCATIVCITVLPPLFLGCRPASSLAAHQRDDIRVQGREVVKQIQEGKSDAVHGRLDANASKAISKEQLAQVFAGVLKQAAIGDRVNEKVSGGQYVATYRYGPRQIEISLAFDGEGKLAGLFLKPILPAGGPGPDPKAGYKTKATLRLPFDGEWWIFWGGEKLEQNYHVAYPDQRHAYDIVMVKNGSTFRPGPKKNESYYCFGLPVLAPADGTIVEAVDGIADNQPGVMNTRQIYGNHVVIDLGNSEFAIICHFKKGSLRVKPGDRVKSGQVLGQCGNSGNSSEPHIHFHLQDGKELGVATGLPAPFTNYLADGKRVKLGAPVRGQAVRNGA